MALPKQVQKQSEEVQELYKELNEDEATEEPVVDAPTSDSVEEPAAESSDERSEDHQDSDWAQNTEHFRVCTTQKSLNCTSKYRIKMQN